MIIAICDDNTVFVDQMKKQLLKAFSELDVEIPQIITCYTGEDLINIEVKIDLAFIDVEMEGISGISAGKCLYERNKDILIFIVTSYEDYIDEALRFHAFRFFRKPVNYKRLLINLNDALEIYKEKNKTIIVEQKRGNTAINTSSIIMIEADGRQSIIYTTNQIISSISSISTIYEQIKDCPCFIQTHRSFIVNLYHVSSFDGNEIRMNEGKYRAKLTRRKYVDFKRSFKAFLNN